MISFRREPSRGSDRRRPPVCEDEARRETSVDKETVLNDEDDILENMTDFFVDFF